MATQTEQTEQTEQTGTQQDAAATTNTPATPQAQGATNAAAAEYTTAMRRIIEQSGADGVPAYTSAKDTYVQTTPPPATQEQLDEEAKQANRGKLMAAIGDGLVGLANLVGTSQYAPNIQWEAASPRVRERYAKIAADHAAYRDNYMAAYRKAVKADNDAALKAGKTRNEQLIAAYNGLYKAGKDEADRQQSAQQHADKMAADKAAAQATADYRAKRLIAAQRRRSSGGSGGGSGRTPMRVVTRANEHYDIDPAYVNRANVSQIYYMLPEASRARVTGGGSYLSDRDHVPTMDETLMMLDELWGIDPERHSDYYRALNILNARQID